jgi:hypothetical protein
MNCGEVKKAFGQTHQQNEPARFSVTRNFQPRPSPLLSTALRAPLPSMIGRIAGNTEACGILIFANHCRGRYDFWNRFGTKRSAVRQSHLRHVALPVTEHLT